MHKEYQCFACNRIMVTSYPSPRFICGECIALLKVIFEENPHLKPE